MARLNFDKVFPLSKLGIPLLLPQFQAKQVELPVDIWGRNARAKCAAKAKTILFYTDDYRFSALLNNPEILADAGIKIIGEVNYTVHANMPYPLAIFQIYKKRYISRYLQEMGIEIMVDLNVPTNYEELNKEGIPKGWNSFVTRGYEMVEILQANFDVARSISGVDYPNLVVYGGGKDVRHFCDKHNLVWITDLNKTI